MSLSMSRGQWSLQRDEEGADRPSSGGGEGTRQEGTCLGSGLDSCGVLSIPVELPHGFAKHGY